MPSKFRFTISIGVLLGCLMNQATANQSALYKTLDKYVESVQQASARIPDDRQTFLDGIAEYVSQKHRREQNARLTFICTHNSRRSHLAQIWCQVFAFKVGLTHVETFSGGTEATACNARTVAALRRSGLALIQTEGGSNPRYLVGYADGARPLEVFSKVYDRVPNPSAEYAAMMCCSDADQSCPNALGSDARFALHYQDPKQSDDTPQEAAVYDERCLQIAAEMAYIMQRASELIADDDPRP